MFFDELEEKKLRVLIHIINVYVIILNLYVQCSYVFTFVIVEEGKLCSNKEMFKYMSPHTFIIIDVVYLFNFS